MRPGVTRLPAYEMMGGYAIGAGGFEFRDVRVSKSQLMLPVGKGFQAAMGGIDIARAGVAAMCAGMLRAGLDVAMPHLLKRQAFGAPLADQQGLMWTLADVATDMEATRLLAFNSAELIDNGESAVEAAAHAKKFATRARVQRSECLHAGDGRRRPETGIPLRPPSGGGKNGRVSGRYNRNPEPRDQPGAEESLCVLDPASTLRPERPKPQARGRRNAPSTPNPLSSNRACHWNRHRSTASVHDGFSRYKFKLVRVVENPSQSIQRYSVWSEPEINFVGCSQLNLACRKNLR